MVYSLTLDIVARLLPLTQCTQDLLWGSRQSSLQQ